MLPVITTTMTDSVALPDAPAIPGLTFRKFRGEPDFPGIVAVFDASKEMDGLDFTTTLDDVRRDYEHLVNCDPYRDVLIAEINGEMIAYSRVYWDHLDDGHWTYSWFGLLKPAWRRKGIGTAMVRYGERCLREIAAQHPSDGPKVFERGAYVSEVGLVKLLENEGYQPVRYGFEMVRPTSEPIEVTPMPAGIQVHPVKKTDVPDVFAAMTEASRDHWGYRPINEEEIQFWMSHPIFNPSLWMVGWAGDEVAGMVLNFIDEAENDEYHRKRGYTETICVRRPWRRQGLARSLLTQSIQMFIDMGMEETSLGVDTQNPNGALNLYQSVGYHVYKRHIMYRKSLD